MLSPINVSLESLNLITLAPMLIAIAGGLIILIMDLLNEKKFKYFIKKRKNNNILIELKNINNINVKNLLKIERDFEGLLLCLKEKSIANIRL